MSTEGKELPSQGPAPEGGVEDSPEVDEVFSILNNPRAWGEVFLANRDGSPRRYRDYQVEDLECDAKKIVHLDGRKVGKTINVATLVLWFCSVNRGKSILVATPHEAQLRAVIAEVEFQIENNGVLKESLIKNPRGSPKIARKPYFELKFANGCVAYFRLAGVQGDAFRSLHVSYLVVDEAAWMTEAAWKAVRQCLNAGGNFRCYSTPNGLRNSTYYRLTLFKDWRVFHWPSWSSPDWTAERERDLEEFYGGKNTPGWQHEVAGEHGAPAYGAFNTTQVLRAVTDIPEYIKVSLHGSELADCNSEEAIRDRLELVLALPGGQGTFWLGGDLGYTADPTELLLLKEEEEGKLAVVLRVHAEQVAYPVITEMIALIDRVYDLAGIGIDKGGNGTSVVQELLTLDKYRERYFTGRLVGYDFGGMTTVGMDDSYNPIKKRTKEHMTALINRALNARRLLLPQEDNEIVEQLCSQTYVLGERGVTYSKGNDHLVDALRCALLRQSGEGSQKDGLIIETPHDVLPIPVMINLPGWS
jgi:hypothetical protein